jgi:hypothetical protein
LPGVEEKCLEMFFLEPGSAGPVGSVYVSDAHILELFDTDDSAHAERQFIRSLPRALLRDYLSGRLNPPVGIGGRPDYVRILAFLCWMQTTKTRQRGDREFREMLEKRLGEPFKGASMSGLNPMWEHLARHLKRSHGIELILPDVEPHPQIGRTLRLAFPTWRDKAVLRRLRQLLHPDRMLVPLEVSNRVNTSRGLLGDRLQSFEYNFDIFDRTWKRGGRDYMETAFWQAWYSVVAEHTSMEDLEIVEGSFGDYEIFRVSPLGDRRPIATPEDASRLVSREVARLIKDGRIPMEHVGPGRYRASPTAPTTTFLVHRAMAARLDRKALRATFVINSSWILVSERAGEEEQPHSGEAGSREFGWHGGIRVGGAYLGRTPLAPKVVFQPPFTVRVEHGGSDLAMERNGDELSLPPGCYAGTVRAYCRGVEREILLVPRANETGDTRRRAFDPEREIGEDLSWRDTVPPGDVAFSPWGGKRQPPSSDLVTIGEALYQRSTRGLPLSEAFEIIRNAVERRIDRPSEWDILRAFTDAGWIEGTILRQFPARRILQRPLSALRTGSGHALIQGPTPIAVVERLTEVARFIGAEMQTIEGISEWALPKLAVQARDDGQLAIFLDRAGLPRATATQAAVPMEGSDSGADGYQIIGRLDDERGYFTPHFDDGGADEGLFRLERSGGRNPFLYRSVVRGKPSKSFESMNIGILNHHMRKRRHVFAHDGQHLISLVPRAYLPASWARWMAEKVLCNPGPRLDGGRWDYAYPSNDEAAEAIGRLVTVTRPATAETAWISVFTASASNRGRAVYDPRSGRVRGLAATAASEMR